MKPLLTLVSLFLVLNVHAQNNTIQTSKLMEPERPLMIGGGLVLGCLLYTSPSPRDYAASRMPSSA